MKIQDILISRSVKGWLAFAMVVCLSISCKKTLDINPTPVTLNGANIFTTDGGLESAVAGMYTKDGNVLNGLSGFSINLALGADDISAFANAGGNVINAQFYANSLSTSQTYFWPLAYNILYVTNTIAEALSGSSAGALTPSIKNQLLGEAKFNRALIYFYLVNLHGDVPLLLKSDYQVNSQATRAPQAEVYKQIVQDLKDAQGSLPDGAYANAAAQPATDRVRPNKQAASALLARVYLYLKDYANAEAAATDVIGKPVYVLEPTLTNTFLKASREIIWQLQQFTTFPANNADAGSLVVTTTPGSFNQYPMSNQLIAAFDTVKDKRWINWVGNYTTAATASVPATTYHFAYKYKAYVVTAPNTENIVVLRLAEQYLIRAEARAQQNNLTGATNDLNVIRSRAGLVGTTATDKNGLLTAILNERQLELFTEFGHRWLDLKRTGALDAVMSVVTPLKGGGAWNPNKQLVPIPSTEIALDPNLTQNPGY